MIFNYHTRLQERTSKGYIKGDILRLHNIVYITDTNILDGDPRIEVKLLPEASTQPEIRPWMSILHTQAGSLKATNLQAWNYANRSEIKNEAHFYGPNMDTGAIIQAMPLNRRADSNLKANSFKHPLSDAVNSGAISFETQDNGSRFLDITPWTLPQIDTLVACLTAIHFTYTIHCTDCTGPYSQGISPHNRYPEWSASAHSCPGKARTRQMDAIRHAVAERLAYIYQDCEESCPT